MKRLFFKTSVQITIGLILAIAFYWVWHDAHMVAPKVAGHFFSPPIDTETIQTNVNLRGLSRHLLDFFK